MRQKLPTETFLSRNKTALTGKTPREKSEASFGSTMLALARHSRTYICKYMLPSHIDDEDLDSGMGPQDKYKAMREKILSVADNLEKITASVNRNQTITGNYLSLLNFDLQLL